MQPILSICVPTYNRARLLEGLLKCLSFQLEDELLSSVEVVISDNCSVDETKEVAERFTNRLKLKYFCNNKNIGVTANILKVIDRATAKYCWIIGDDDLLVHGAIKDVLKTLKSNPGEAGIVVGYSYEKIDRRSEVEKAYSCDFSSNSICLLSNSFWRRRCSTSSS